MVANARATIYVCLVFATGLVLGATGVVLAEHTGLRHTAEAEYDLSQHREVAQRLTDQLHLSDGQHQQVDQILQDTLQHYRDLQGRLEPQYDAIRDADRARLLAVLTPDQRIAFDRLAHDADLRYPANVRPEVLAGDPCNGATPSGH